MASETLSTDESRENQRWSKNTKVYTRKFYKKRLKHTSTSAFTAVPTTATVVNATSTTTYKNNNGEKDSGNNGHKKVESLQALATVDGNSWEEPLQELPSEQLNSVADDSSRHNWPPEVENGNLVINEQSSQALAAPDGNSWQQPQQEQILTQVNAVADDSSRHSWPNGNKVIKPILTRVDNRVSINFAAANSKDEIREIRSMLLSELDQVRSLVKQLEAKEVQISNAYSCTTAAAYSQPLHLGNNVIERRNLVRVNPEMGSEDYLESSPFQPGSLQVIENNYYGDGRGLMNVNSEVGCQDYRPFQQLGVSVMESNNHIHGVGEFVEKQRRTPKANQFYWNSDFLLGKDRLPPETNRKVKSNGRRKHGGEIEYGFVVDRYRNQAFKNCSNLLQRLMKHKHGWVFNKPVDAKLLGLHDYHDIVKHPMDLGTIKNRLGQNFYKSPRDFAEDVRLTFRNAMTYNPMGQDVHLMAMELSDIFEGKWVVIEAKYNPDWGYEMNRYGGLSAPPSRKFPPPMMLSDGSESMTVPVYSIPTTPSVSRVSRMPVPKKPKANDPNKRDMTFKEKQKLSANLQSLPSEKIGSIIEIIMKRNSDLSQHDNELEVDIDSVDTETLWELDRCFTNYKKSLSKYKRRAELAQARAKAGHTLPALNLAPIATVAPKESKTDEMNVATASPILAEKQGDNVSGSSSSSSSSSDSGSSSSDSDSDSSSAYGSDGGHSPRTIEVD